jgi:hypothetical protein
MKNIIVFYRKASCYYVVLIKKVKKFKLVKRSQKSRVTSLVAVFFVHVTQQIKLLLKLIVVLLGLRPNYCINDFILIRFYKIVIFRLDVGK